MDVDYTLPFWPRMVSIIEVAEDRTFKLFGLDAKVVKRGGTTFIAPLLLFAIAFALMVVSYVITSMLIKQPKVKPAALEDWEFPQADDGTPEAVLFGDGWLTGPMVIWYGNYMTKKIKAKGGKK